MTDKDPPDKSLESVTESAIENRDPDSILTIDEAEIDEVKDTGDSGAVNQGDGKPQGEKSAERILEAYENDAFDSDQQSAPRRKSVFRKTRRMSVVKFLGRQISVQQSAKKMVKIFARSYFRRPVSRCTKVHTRKATFLSLRSREVPNLGSSSLTSSQRRRLKFDSIWDVQASRRKKKGNAAAFLKDASIRIFAEVGYKETGKNVATQTMMSSKQVSCFPFLGESCTAREFSVPNDAHCLRTAGVRQE